MTSGMDELRLIGPCIATGEAAGTAAAISVKNNIRPRDIDIKELQRVLKHKTLP
jgi:hypothetical protein